MKRVNIKFNSFANEAEKKEVMLAAYKAAICKMNDMMIFPPSSEIDLGSMTVSFTVRDKDVKAAARCLKNLAA